MPGISMSHNASTASSGIPFAGMSDETIGQTGKRFGYGNWLQPIINANDRSDAQVAGDSVRVDELEQRASTSPPRRGRGRPRVTNLRDASAIEV